MPAQAEHAFEISSMCLHMHEYSPKGCIKVMSSLTQLALPAQQQTALVMQSTHLDVCSVHECQVNGLCDVAGGQHHDVGVALERIQLGQEGVDCTDGITGLRATYRGFAGGSQTLDLCAQSVWVVSVMRLVNRHHALAATTQMQCS